MQQPKVNINYVKVNIDETYQFILDIAASH